MYLLLHFVLMLPIFSAVLSYQTYMYSTLLLNWSKPQGGGGTPYSGLNGEAPPKGVALFLVVVYKRVGKMVYATESERLKTWEKHGDYRKICWFGLSLSYKKGVQFCSRYVKVAPFW